MLHVAVELPPTEPLDNMAAAGASGAADPAWALNALGSSVKGFIVGSYGNSVAPVPGDTPQATGMFSTYKGPYKYMVVQEVRDLSGTSIATIQLSSNHVGYGYSARIVATDGTLIASVEQVVPTAATNHRGADMPHPDLAKAPIQILVGGCPYASATIEGQAMDKDARGYGSAFVSKVTLTRNDGSGGLKVAERSSNKGYLLMLGAAIAIPTACLGQVIVFQMAHEARAVHGLTSPDGKQRFPPVICQGSTAVCAFSAADMPSKHAASTNKYLHKHPGTIALEAAAKLDVLLMLAVVGAAGSHADAAFYVGNLNNPGI